MNEIVMYNNDLNTLVLPESFSDTELKIFFAICSRLRDHGSEEVTFSYAYLKELTKEKRHMTKKEYSEMVKGVYHKLIGARFVYESKERQVEGEVNIFQGYEKSLTDESFTISITPAFYYIFNELSLKGSFTAWNLSDFCNLPGVYSKQLYRLLKQWKYVGACSFSIEDLRSYLGAPKKYSTKDFVKEVLNKAVSKLMMNCPEFMSLKFFFSKSGKKIVRVRFTWNPEKRILKNTKPNLKGSEEIKIEEKTKPYNSFLGPMYFRQQEEADEDENTNSTVKLTDFIDVDDNDFPY